MLLITSQLSLTFPLHILSKTFFVLAHPSFHSCISSESPTDPPVWAVTVRVEVAFPIALQQGSPGQFQTQSIVCLIFSSDKITSQVTGKLTQTSSIHLTTQLPQTARNLQSELTAPLWNMQGKINSSGKRHHFPGENIKSSYFFQAYTCSDFFLSKVFSYGNILLAWKQANFKEQPFALIQLRKLCPRANPDNYVQGKLFDLGLMRF